MDLEKVDANNEEPVSGSTHKILSTLRALQTHRRVRKLMQELELPFARSWPDMISVLEANWSQTLESKLFEIYEELRLFGRKHVFLFEAPKNISKIIPVITKLQPEQKFNQTYPYPHEFDSDQQSDGPSLAAVKKIGDNLTLVFMSPRVLRRETPFDIEWLIPEYRDDLRTADVKVIKHSIECAFDAIAIPLNGGYIEVRVDLFSHFTDPSPGQALSNVVEALENLIVKAGASFKVFGPAVDLSSVMLPIYKNKKEGNIAALEFLCSTKTRRREIMTAKGGVDLRQEVYHKSGVKSLGAPIIIFREAVEWFKDDKGNDLENAHMLFHGYLDHTSLAPRSLYEVRICRMTGKLEYDFMMARLRNYVD